MPNDLRRALSRRGFLLATGATLGGVAAQAHAQPATEKSVPVQTAAQPGDAGKRATGPRIEIADILPPAPGALWRMVKQCGVNHVVGTWESKAAASAGGDEAPWSHKSLERLKKSYEQGGFQLAVIESRPPMTKTKFGLPGRDEEIAVVCELVRNMGALGIPVWCYQWIALGVLRTSSTLPSRGGALVTGYDHALMSDAPLTEYGVVKDEQLWAALKYFLDRVLPVAEKANVKLAMHPDDPPRSPIRGVARIMRSVENFQRLLDLTPSPVNGITLCQGNFTLMTDDLPGVIRQFGKQKKIFFVHFRDVRGTADKFEETFHDDGKTDMSTCMRAYREVGYDGVCRVDHVPTMEGDSNDKPGYSSIGRLFAIGYAKGLRDAVYSE